MFIPFIHRIVRKHLTSQGIRSNRIQVGSTLLHYYEASPPHPLDTLVLVHGLGTSASTWTYVLPELAKEYHVIAPDLPGFGFSLPGDTFVVHSIDDYVSLLREFLGLTVRKDFVLLGHSLGGWLTMKYVARQAQQVNSLILVNTAGVYYHGYEELARLFEVKSIRDTNRLLDRIWKRYPWYYRPFTPFVFEDLVRRKVPEIVAGIQEQDFMNSSLDRLLMPVDIIWGKADRLISAETVAILEERLPARTVHYIEDSGHVPQLERPVEFLRIVREVLRNRVL